MCDVIEPAEVVICFSMVAVSITTTGDVIDVLRQRLRRCSNTYCISKLLATTQL